MPPLSSPSSVLRESANVPILASVASTVRSSVALDSLSVRLSMMESTVGLMKLSAMKMRATTNNGKEMLFIDIRFCFLKRIGQIDREAESYFPRFLTLQGLHRKRREPGS